MKVVLSFLIVLIVFSACSTGDASKAVTKDKKVVAPIISEPGMLEMPTNKQLGVSFVIEEDVENEVKAINEQLASLEVVAVKSFPQAKPGGKNWEIKKALGMDKHYVVQTADVDYVKQVLDSTKAKEVKTIQQPIPQLVTNNPLYNQQWHHENTGSNPEVPPGTPDADMDSPGGWNEHTGGVLVTNIEMVDWDHEDLVDRLWQNVGEDADGDGKTIVYSGGQWAFDNGDLNGVDDDNNGYVDDLIGLYDGGWDPFHGTFTATLLLGSDNNKGGVGMCYNCQLMSVIGSNDANRHWEEYAIDNGAKVLSRSIVDYDWGGFDTYIAYAEAMNVNIVYAAGNDDEFNENFGCSPDYVLCVGGLDENDNSAVFATSKATSYGDYVDVAAPAFSWSGMADDQYSYQGGTSIAAPLVAGVIGLIKSENPGLEAREINSILISTTDRINTLDKFLGTGRVNAQRALQKASQVSSFPYGYVNYAFNAQDQELVDFSITAQGTRLDSWELYYGDGLYPSNWNLLTSGSTAETDHSYTWDTSSLAQGTYHFQLRIYDRDGEMAIKETYLETKKSLPIVPGFPLGSNVNSFFVNNRVDGATVYTVTETDAGSELLLLEVNAYEDGNLLNTWPLIQVGKTSGSYHKISSVDLDNDGNEEIILTFRQSLDPIDHTVKIFDYQGNVIQEWVNEGWFIEQNPYFANIDDDPEYEIIVAENTRLRIFELDGTKRTINTPDKYNNVPFTIGDIDADGVEEIFYATLSDAYRVVGVEGNGDPIAEYFSSPNSLSTRLNHIRLANVDEDKELEVIAVTKSYLHVIDTDRTVLHTFQTPREYSVPFFGKLLDDELRLVLIRSSDIFITDFAGTEILHELAPINPVTGAKSPIELFANLDADPELELLGNMLFELDGTPLDPSVTEASSSIELHDIDNDGVQELVRVLDDGTLGAWELDQDVQAIKGWTQEHHDEFNSGNFHYYCTETLKNNECASQIPNKCMNGMIIPGCEVCGCEVGLECRADGTCSEPVPDPPPPRKPKKIYDPTQPVTT